MEAKSAIIRPVLTEKSNLLKEKGIYTFYVNPKMNKIEVKKVFKTLFQVDVEKVSVVNKHAKEKLTRQGLMARTVSRKKVLVTLKKDQKINLFEV